jgi:bifunctional DNase/RNase
MRELDVVGVRVEMPSNQPIILLREVGTGRHLPVWVGAVEATAVAVVQQGQIPPRPLTHDLLKNVLDALGTRLEQVVITQVRDGVFHSELVLSGGIRVDSRTSDAIALALRAGAPIFGADEVLAEVGIEVPEAAEDEVEKFREFLDQISPEDFSAGDGPTGDAEGDPGASR